MRYILMVLAGLLSSYAFGQTPTDNWEKFKLQDDALGEVSIHVTKNAIDSRKPLILFLEGSGNFPLYYRYKDGRFGTGTTLNFRQYSSEYHIALISKPGIPFLDSIRTTESGRRYYPTNSDFTEKYSLDWRAKSASLAIDHLIKELAIDTSKIIVIGHSEGSQVAPAVAVENPKVTHVISMMGNSLNHLYDFIINERMRVERGEIAATEAQTTVDSLFAEYEKIYTNPKSTTDYWYGETYYKWSSFTLISPLENMLKLDIPILYIAGGKDQNQTIINMDYARLEFLRKGKTNLTYKVYPNYDHFFQERIVKNEKTDWIDHIDEVHEFAIRWTDEN